MIPCMCLYVCGGGGGGVCVCVYNVEATVIFYIFFISISLGDDDARLYLHTYTLSHTQKHAQEEYVGFVCKIRIGTLRITQLRGVQSRFLSIKKQHVA